MCSGHDKKDSVKVSRPDMSVCNLLDLAASNDLEGFKRLMDGVCWDVNGVGLWYGRQRGAKRMLMEERTPLMIAATYGSIDVVKFIVSLSDVDVNKSCGTDKTTALHCAASGGSVNAFDVVKVLLVSGADAALVDANGCRAIDVVSVPPNLPRLKIALEKLFQNGGTGVELACEKKEFPIVPFSPDVKSDVYLTDEFRMFAFKIRPCSRAYSHDWTECPFIHPGESARRRDPRRIHYSCVPCPDFKKGQCRQGDLCEFAHGVFECWLHPAQYRTRLCKDGTFCARRVCFFAHTPDQLRPLYVSTGSALPSPRGSPPPMLHLPGGNPQANRMFLDLEMHRQQQQQMTAFSPSNRHMLLSPTHPYSPKGFFDYRGSYGLPSPRIVSPQSHMAPFSPHVSKGNMDWSVNRLPQQSTELDVSWVESLVKEPPPLLAPDGSEMKLPETEKIDHAALSTWLENMKINQIVA